MTNPGRLKVVSFDLEGTLIKPDFSSAVWGEAIPERYAQLKGIDIARAKGIVFAAYDEVGDQRREWYDIKYWFCRFGLGDYREALESCKHLIGSYPEVPQVLGSLARHFLLIVASGSSRDFLDYLLPPLPPAFARVFSSISDFGQLKTPLFYRQISKALGVRAEEMVHIGDSRQFDFAAPPGGGHPGLSPESGGER